ncbi:Glycerophosphoryl diester phosphodiesterase [Rubripirellula lacrimiformis]|uniref:Glycerophosphoryl diester phosphodiesterase n=1 Tax=Rubripirellula lacrimiformis TaxID=1930273 RepID=A0A517N594_9BACT|nr:glycerophosphodiester phosphodiesterase family protein [Rubripirellula lacrimiformis]QDT02310.1 Glycerophosphoryl diester phosphodiesterase [Rubripirellula lacrimiformis]
MSTIRFQHLGLIAIGVLLTTSIDAQESKQRTSAPANRVHCPSTPAELKQLLTAGNAAFPLLSAHRGGPTGQDAENSLTTFQRATEVGFLLIEVDPRLTADGVPVLLHDSTLDRTTTGTGKLSEHRWADLSSIRLRDMNAAPTDQSIPTLRQAIQWAQGRCVLVLDSKDASVAERVQMITELKAEASTMMLTYSIKDAAECYRLNPDIMMEVGITNRKQLDQFDRCGVPWSNIVAFVGHKKPADRQLLEMIHQRGACCMAGTSRNLDKLLHPSADESDTSTADLKSKYQQLIEMGVDIIETDRPHDVWALIAESTN